MKTLSLLTPNTVALAYLFVEGCEDESPKQYGVDLSPAFPVRREGVYRLRSPVEPVSPWHGENVEDWLIAQLEAQASDDDDDAGEALFIDDTAYDGAGYPVRDDGAEGEGDDDAPAASLEPQPECDDARWVLRYRRGRNGSVCRPC